MLTRILRRVGRVVITTPGWVVTISLGLTFFLYLHIHHLRTDTNLTDMFGKHDAQWQAASKIGNDLGYGNQLFVILQVPSGDEDHAATMEAMADRLTEQMSASGLFQQERSGLQENELLNIVRFYTWNFPFLSEPDQWGDLQQRLDPQQIRQNVSHAATQMVTPFSSMGVNYFVADPLGLMGAAAKNSQSLSQFASLDLNWGSGNRFFSKDHRALLILVEPRQSAVDYKSAAQVVQWTRTHIASLVADPEFRSSGVHVSQAGAYVYAAQDHAFIERNIRVVSFISLFGNLLLCLFIYPSIPMLLLSLLPASLGIICTTGIASYYPGEMNLISLSFIAILGGLGDDQVVHFFNRTPQEWTDGRSFNEAVLRTFETTGVSIVLCIVTAASATVALAFSGFKALADFGFILTVGMFMMMFHTLLTVPALLQLWRRFFPPTAPKTITFRFLPRISNAVVHFVGKYARGIVLLASVAFVASLLVLPTIHLGGSSGITSGADDSADVAQKLLAAEFGIQGNPHLLLITGTQQEVLQRAEKLSAHLKSYEAAGVVKSIFSPTSLIPSAKTQQQRAAMFLQKVNLAASANALQQALKKNGFRVAPELPYIQRLQTLSHGAEPLALNTAAEYLPRGLLDNSIRKTSDGRYVAAITYDAADPNATLVIPDAVLRQWKRDAGPFVDFSFDKINRDMQRQILHDSSRALVWTAAAILLIVYCSFRNLRLSLLVLMPIVFAIIVAFGILRILGHPFTFMAVTAIPLIIGIGIDNGIHLVRRYRDSGHSDILDVTRDTGAALIQSNLTTIIGFGALTASTFAPLAELGLVTSLGVSLALVGGLCLIPATIILQEPNLQERYQGVG